MAPAAFPRPYLIYRLSPDEPWKVHPASAWYPSGGEYAAWRGASYDEATKECRKMNAERKGAR